MRTLAFAAVVLLYATGAVAAPQTGAYEFVSNYIQGLASLEEIRAKAEQQLSAGNQMSDCIENATSMQLELRSQIALFNNTQLTGAVSDVPQQLAALFQEKIALWQQMSDICSSFVSGPRPGTDYGPLAAEVPKITAKIDFVDKAIFEASPLVFVSLLDSKPDSQGHMSRLAITKAQRDKLVWSLQNDFGKKLDQKNQNWTVSAASVLRTYLTKKGYKCSDET